jgi:hypothetical protein
MPGARPRGGGRPAQSAAIDLAHRPVNGTASAQLCAPVPASFMLFPSVLPLFFNYLADLTFWRGRHPALKLFRFFRQ